MLIQFYFKELSLADLRPGGSILQSSSYTAPYHPSRKLSKLDEPDMRDTAGEVRTNS